MRFGTHNVKGLAAKIQPLVRMWQQLRLDIVAIQEHHVVEQDQVLVQRWLSEACIELGCSPWHVFWGPSVRDPHSRGVAILVRSSLLSSGAMVCEPLPLAARAADDAGAEALGQVDERLAEGRLQLLRVRWAGHHLRLLNVYAPASDDQKLAFVEHCLSRVPTDRMGQRGQLLLMGDLNFTMTHGLDRCVWRQGVREAPAQRAAERQVAEAFVDAFGAHLTDTFRTLHPDRTSFTHFYQRQEGLGASRLDQIWCTPRTQGHVLSCDHAQFTVSDHRCVVLHLAAANDDRLGPGRASIPADFLEAGGAALLFGWGEACRLSNTCRARP